MAKNNSEVMDHDFNTYLKVAGICTLGILTLFLIVKTINEAKTYSTIGEGNADIARTITVAGHGEVIAQPDIATFSWTVTEDGKTIAQAQSAAATKSNKAIEYLKSQGVPAGDISTTYYNTSEKYVSKPCVLPADDAVSSTKIVPPCPPNQEVDGYTTNQTVEVKLRNIAQNDPKLSTYISEIGKIGVKPSQVYFSFDKPENVKMLAQQVAIQNARAKATKLAQSLGIKLGKVVGFSDNSGSYPAAYGGMALERASIAKDATVAPELPSGDKEVTSDVSVTYEIK